jgi:hypothetical protein
MAKLPLILPSADSGCGRVFYNDRRNAYGHRVALDLWNRATGRARDGVRLVVYRCKRCGGFHVGRKRIDSALLSTDRATSLSQQETSFGPRER